jgi:hypothetical protein
MTGARRIFWLCFLPLVWGEIALFAQIGGPFPGGGYPPGGYPPGGYPPGTYPGGGGVGLPIPHRGGKKKNSKQDAQPTQSIEGMLRRLDDKELVLEATDTRLLSLKRTASTKFLDSQGDPMKPADVKPGDHLQIDATQDDQGYFTAVTVNFTKPGTGAERAAAAQPVEVSTRNSQGDDKSGADSDPDPDRPRIRRADSKPPQEPTETPEATPAPSSPAPAATSSPVATSRPAPAPPAASDDAPLPPAKRDPDDPGPPVLRRGRPAARASSQTTEVASSQGPASKTSSRESSSDEAAPLGGRVMVPEGQETRPAPITQAQGERPGDPIVAKAADAAESFSETLPNYVCQQFTARFVSTTHNINWQAQDIVSTDVVYENGRESYRNLKINGKVVKKGAEEETGAWSTGEFGTLLRDLFSPATAAEFHFRKDSLISGKSAGLYDFTVQHETSHWRVQVASQSVFPPYKGSVWIDKNNGRVLRIEMQARNMPSEFPLDTVETVAEYAYVRIGGIQEFLLPVHSETLSCQRGTNYCSRNSIDFRNYKKYSGEASITFEK